MLRPIPTFILLALSACAPGSEAPCQTTEDAVALGESTAAGSADSVLSLVEGTEQHRLTGPAVGEVDLFLAVQWTGDEAAWSDSEPRSEAVPTEADGMYGDGEPLCADRLSVPVNLRFSTDDGSFDESWVVEVAAHQPGSASVVHEVSVESLEGTWRPEVDGYSSLRVRVHVTWTEEGSVGRLQAVGWPEDGGAEESWDVAVWPG